MAHTFELGYYCKKDNMKLNDKKENRSGYCEILDTWKKCDDCHNFDKR